MSKKYSTKTMTEEGSITPWLVASGELAYTPENPPTKDYFFQYGWVLPDIIPRADRKRHYYFGHHNKGSVFFIFDFWNQAREGKSKQTILCYGQKNGIEFRAPIAVYQYTPTHNGDNAYLLIQHGSYQRISIKSQPLISKGLVIIYRGIGKSKEYRYLKVDSLNKKQDVVLEKYFAVQEKTFSDSVLSFNIAHSQIFRCETDFLNKECLTWDDVANSLDFKRTKDRFANWLAASYFKSFTLEKLIASGKFGPNYVECITPISNIRLTTFFAGEWEVNAIDPRKIEIIKTVGCKEKAIYL